VPLEVSYATEHIDVTSPTTDVTIQGLIDFIRTQTATARGISESRIADASGKESLGGGVTVGITLELLSPWQLHFWEGAYSATISGGNLVGGIADDPIAYSAGVQVVVIQSAASTIVSASADENIIKLLNNKQQLEKVGSVWHMRTYDDDNTTILYDSVLKDKDGNDITDLVAGAIAIRQRGA